MPTDHPKQKSVLIFEHYPAWIIAVANALAFSIYLLGAIIMAQLGTVPMILYLGLCLFLEMSVLARSCVNCYYYGKACFSGKGILCAWLFKPGDSKIFARKEIRWLDLLPDMLVVLIPMTFGIFLLIWQFQWQILVLMLGLLILAFPGNGMIRGALACCHCQQRVIGCPAEKLFQKQKT